MYYYINWFSVFLITSNNTLRLRLTTLACTHIHTHTHTLIYTLSLTHMIHTKESSIYLFQTVAVVLVAWAVTRATLHPAGRLGLHQDLRSGCCPNAIARSVVFLFVSVAKHISVGASTQKHPSIVTRYLFHTHSHIFVWFCLFVH